MIDFISGKRGSGNQHGFHGIWGMGFGQSADRKTIGKYNMPMAIQ